MPASKLGVSLPSRHSPYYIFTDLENWGLGSAPGIGIFLQDLGGVSLPVLHIAVLALVQGITEFLPISSQAHLQLVSAFTGWADQGLVMVVAVHVGTLGAVMVYFWRDLWAMTVGIAQLARGRRSPGARLAGYLIVGTLPAVAAGYLLNRYYPNGIRGLEIIGWTTLGFGILLYIADKIGMTVRRFEHLKLGDIIIIGCAQAIMAMDMRPTNPSITKPTLVICGEEDTGTTPEQAKEIADTIPGAALELLPNAAHLANIEQPVAFTNSLLQHLLANR